jgi:hypothetical protein
LKVGLRAVVQAPVGDDEWNDAIMLRPLLDPLTWMQRRYDWPVEPGRHTSTVRVIDEIGEMQVGLSSDPHPEQLN